MSTPLRILMVEDSEDDAELLLLELRRGGYGLVFERVETADTMRAALQSRQWDVVVADYAMPHFNGLAALRLLKGSGLDIPFIVVSGTIGEEIAVDTMKAGAHDYLMKGDLARLVPAIQRELREAEERKERRRAQDALRESEARFRRLAENAPDLIFRYEVIPARRFSYVSPVATNVVGHSPEEFYADPDLFSRLVHKDDRPRLRGLSEVQVIADPQPTIWRHRDGREVWIEKRIVQIRDDSGSLVALEGIVRDITGRKLMEEQLLRGQRLEEAGRIAGQVAHDFNNLLTPMAGYPQLIKRRLPDGHPATRYCDIMLESVQRMAEINEDMMAMGRRGHFERRPIDLNKVVEDAVEQILSKRPASLMVELELDPDLLAVTGSPAQLLRVAANLLSNAREAMQDVGLLMVRTANVYIDQPVGQYNSVEIGEYARLTTSDTGCGIAPDIRGKIFDAFFTTKFGGKRRGSGLGLSVVQAIVADHRGYVDLESEVGKGTTFSVYLPVSREKAVDRTEGELQGGSESILVVDDDRLQQEVVIDLLQTLGYRVEAVSSGDEAVRYLEQQPADLLLLDMVMPPGIDGAETYRRVLGVRPGQRAVIVSGFAESERVLQARALGAGAYLRKPLTMETLGRAVREELDRAGR